MENRCKKNVLESENYANPPIPDGWKHVLGEWNNGYVIERSSDGSQFVWIPVGILDADGTLDGVKFNEKFGRRNYRDDIFCNDGFHEPLEGELLKQLESVNKYGGFYISSYNISTSSEGKPQSVKGVMPWRVNWYEAMNVAATFEESEDVRSHLPFGAEYDCMLAWFIKSEVKNFDEIARDSSNWGNYLDNNNFPRNITPTGSNKEWCVNNIFDVAGNVREWTQECSGIKFPVFRGGSYNNYGSYNPVSSRYESDPANSNGYFGSRAVLYIK